MGFFGFVSGTMKVGLTIYGSVLVFASNFVGYYCFLNKVWITFII